MAAGFLVFYWVYRLAVGASRDLSEAHVSRAELAYRFAPPLLAIAAGYHLAHYLGYFLRLFPGWSSRSSTPFRPRGRC